MFKKYLILIASALIIIGLITTVIVLNTDKLSDTILFVGSIFKTRNFIMPVNGVILTSFNSDTHNGIDIAAKIGTPVKACSDGSFTEIKNDEGVSGVTVVIDHGNELFSYYTGLSENITVRFGQKIKVGDVIGSVGKTNIVENNLTSHLHFAIKNNGSWENPLTYFD